MRAAIERWSAEWQNGGDRIAFAARDPHTLVLMGGCELRRDGGHAQLSYWTFPPYRRRGVAAAALRLVCDFAATELGVATFEARVDPANLASRRVAEKAGFVAQGTMHEDSGAERVRYLHRV